MDYKQEQLEKKLSQLAQDLDNSLEDKFGSLFSIHPNRLKRGQGSNPSFDGLFATTIAFTLGYGSKYGRGYIVNIEIRTLESPSDDHHLEIKNFAYNYLSENIKTVFPDRDLHIVKDGRLLKIIGDFSLS